MSRRTRRKTLILAAASALAGATALGEEPSGKPDRAALQAGLAPLSVDTRAQAADVGREIALRTLTVTHCVMLRAQEKIAAMRGEQRERS